jgi:16S rRNA (cytosine1402-N4)-methyltransferase
MKHVSVMLKEAVDVLDIQNGDIIIDGTLGGAGHTGEICERFGEQVKVLAMDLDVDAIDHARGKFIESDCRIRFYQENFKDLDKVLTAEHLDGVDAILLDLGYSSDQLESGGRGFSFKTSEPLKMTLKKELSDTEFNAEDIVNNWDEEDYCERHLCIRRRNIRKRYC